MKKTFRILVGIISATLVFTSCSAKSEVKKEKPENPIINFYNWGDYIDESLITQFEDETGYKVNYSMFTSNEDMYAKIKSGGTSYDLAIPSDYMIDKMRNEEMLEKINLENIPNYKHIGEKFKNLSFDENNEYSVPYMWGTVGILYNKNMVTDPVDSWDILWNTKYSGDIYMYDSQRDSIGVTLKKLGYSLNSTNDAEIQQAKDELIAQKPLVQTYVGDPVKDKMIGEEGALAVVYSGDAVYCMEENENLAYAIPKEGSNAWFDSMIIPKGAKNIEGAESLINFLSDPEVALKNTEYIGYSTTNLSTYDLLEDTMKTNPAYWPSDEEFGRCEIYKDLSDYIKEYDIVWTEILAS